MLKGSLKGGFTEKCKRRNYNYYRIIFFLSRLKNKAKVLEKVIICGEF